MIAVKVRSIMQLVVGIYQGASYDDEEHEPYAAAIMVGLSSAFIYVGPSLAVKGGFMTILGVSCIAIGAFMVCRHGKDPTAWASPMRFTLIVVACYVCFLAVAIIALDVLLLMPGI